MSKPLKWIKLARGWYTCQPTEGVHLSVLKIRRGQGWSIYVRINKRDGMLGDFGWERLIPDMYTHRAKAECIEFAKQAFGDWT